MPLPHRPCTELFVDSPLFFGRQARKSGEQLKVSGVNTLSSRTWSYTAMETTKRYSFPSVTSFVVPNFDKVAVQTPEHVHTHDCYPVLFLCSILCVSQSQITLISTTGRICFLSVATLGDTSHLLG
jgi:hypothetical protein